MKRWTAPVLLPALALAAACGEPGAGRNGWLVEITEGAGLAFVHETRASGELLLPEIMGGGAALLDYDGDGDLDLYLTSGGRNQLYRQEATGRFVDATEQSGLGDDGYGMGVAVGDIDNDGDLDVYLTNYGPDRLYRNRGDGTFEDRTAQAGIAVGGWSSSATFLDYDRDGFLDLYVVRYVEYDPGKRCTDASGRPDYCSPAVFPPATDVMLHNNGDGTFCDTSAEVGIRAAIGAGLGVVAADFDDDGWIDVYVANDGDPNQLWLNGRDGTFGDSGPLLGVAYNLEGEAEAGMGVLAEDLDSDLDLDLFLTHLAHESNTLYRNRGAERGFEDATGPSGLALDSLVYTGFGTAAVDLELDGDLDLIVVNGRVTHGPPHPDAHPGAPWDRFAEPNRVYLNGGDGRFTLAEGEFKGFADGLEISRGLAAGDIDEDGDVDLLVVNIEGPARLFRNDAPRVGHWLTIRAVDPRLRRDAIGARMTLVGPSLRRRRSIAPGSGYLSSHDPRAHFGLRPEEQPELVEVRWPDGLVESFRVPGVDRQITLLRGSGEPAS